MTIRPPAKPTTDLWSKSPAGVLHYEIVQETASALGRQGRALEAALTALTAFDAAATAGDVDPSARMSLVANAAQALWQFMVQREACGLRDGAAVVRLYNVPAEVRDRVGVFPPRRP